MKKDERFIFLIGQAQNRLFTRLDQSLMKAAGITAAQSGALYYLGDRYVQHDPAENHSQVPEIKGGAHVF